jgi:hypothetical protein
MVQFKARGSSYQHALAQGTKSHAKWNGSRCNSSSLLSRDGLGLNKDHSLGAGIASCFPAMGTLSRGQRMNCLLGSERHLPGWTIPDHSCLQRCATCFGSRSKMDIGFDTAEEIQPT